MYVGVRMGCCFLTLSAEEGDPRGTSQPAHLGVWEDYTGVCDNVCHEAEAVG